MDKESVKSAIRKAVDERKEKACYDFHGVAYYEMYEFLGDKYVTIPKDEYKHLLRCKEELADLRNDNHRRKSAERTLRRIIDDDMTAICSRQRTIEEQWEVMRELQRRCLVSAEDLEAVLKDVAHVARMRF